MTDIGTFPNTPLVSVIIPCYNPTELRRTLESVCKQSHSNWEVFCIDDGSDTEFSSIVTIDNSRISYHRMEKHTNANVARNWGISHCHGEYIAMLDSDDEWMETHLEDSIQMLQEKKIDGIYSSLILRSAKHDSVFTTRKRHTGETMIDFLLSAGYGAQTSTLVMTASSVKDIKWDETLKRHQDYDFIVRYSQKYNLLPKIEPTVIYYLSIGSKIIDFDSCIRFIHNVEDSISDRIYMNYHKHMLKLAIDCKATENIITYYRRQATYYEFLLPLYDYLMILQPQSKYKAWILKIKYIWKVFLVSIE